jgi:hypothetical protein
MGEVHWNTYHAPREKDEPLSPHKERDGAAFAYLMPLLAARRGLEFGRLLINYPSTYRITSHALEVLRAEGLPEKLLERIGRLQGEPPLHKAEFSEAVKKVVDAQEASRHTPSTEASRHMASILEAALVEVKVDTSFLKPDDYVVQTTRPFLHDHLQEGHKAGERSNTSLEIKTFGFLERFFEKLSRAQVRLSASMAQELEKAARLRGDDSANKAEIKFLIHTRDERARGSYNEFKRRGALKWSQPSASEKREGIYKTAVYLVHAENVLDNGAGLIVAFGMHGLATLALAYLLRTGTDGSGKALAPLIDCPSFVMAEMTVGTLPTRPNDLSFLSDWKVKILLEHPIAPAESAEKSVNLSGSPS